MITLITIVGLVSGVVAVAACVLYPVKNKKSKTVLGFKVRDNA